jgi:peptidoglycan/LPS O-acetylase OafA/YrhL
MARFGSLDGLRALAIVPVVWHHATPHPIDGALGRGPLGVDLFFAISGFLITTLLLRERDERTIDLRGFYVRRTLRIFPLYYVVLGAFIGHACFIRAPGAPRDHFLASLPWYATYTSNWFVDNAVPHAVVFSFAWSLATEEQFYLGFPWILRFTKGILPAALFMTAVVLVDQGAERGWIVAGALATRMMKSLATPIALGSLAALALRTPIGGAMRAMLGAKASAPILLALLAAGAILPWPVLTVHMLMTALVVACCLREDHWLAPLLASRPLQHIGIVSYGIYLVNVPCVQLAQRIAHSTVAVFAIGLALSIALASLTRVLIEEPFLGLRRAAPREAGSPASMRAPSF